MTSIKQNAMAFGRKNQNHEAMEKFMGIHSSFMSYWTFNGTSTSVSACDMFA